jgi:hypothetical protein
MPLHRGVAEDDPRNSRLLKLLASMKPTAPISQSVAQIPDPYYELGTHPDIVEHMWKLAATLPERCRWVVCGWPGFVHPRTGVVFGIGLGTIGLALRLPPSILAMADAMLEPRHPSQVFDISPAGPQWRFATWSKPEAEWCRASYECAGEPA